MLGYRHPTLNKTVGLFGWKKIFCLAVPYALLNEKNFVQNKMGLKFTFGWFGAGWLK